MSTYVYLACLDHDPPIRADAESDQHAHADSVIDRIRGWLNIRHALVGLYRDGDLPGGDRYLDNTVRFLNSHVDCRHAAVTEYGEWIDLGHGIPTTRTPAPDTPAPGDPMAEPLRPIPLTCTDTELVVHMTLPDLGLHPLVLPHIPDRIEAWLAWHGLSIDDVAIGYAITRDPEQRTLTWTGVSESRALCDTVGALAEKILREPPPRMLGDAVVWPAPFPPEVLKASEHIQREAVPRGAMPL